MLFRRMPMIRTGPKTKFALIALAMFLFIAIIVRTVIWLPLAPTEEDQKKERGNESTETKPVIMDVYYESHCPDSKNFVLRQLLPLIKKNPKLVSVHLVPYGKAKTTTKNGSYVFECQHGPIECLGNKIHACGLQRLRDQINQVGFVACMLGGDYNPIDAGKKCANEYSLDWESINNCSQSNEGDRLLKEMGELTEAVSPSITFIPTIDLNKSHSKLSGSLKNLQKEVCAIFQTLPPECES